MNANGKASTLVQLMSNSVYCIVVVNVYKTLQSFGL